MPAVTWMPSSSSYQSAPAVAWRKPIGRRRERRHHVVGLDAESAQLGDERVVLAQRDPGGGAQALLRGQRRRRRDGLREALEELELDVGGLPEEGHRLGHELGEVDLRELGRRDARTQPRRLGAGTPADSTRTPRTQPIRGSQGVSDRVEGARGRWNRGRAPGVENGAHHVIPQLPTGRLLTTFTDLGVASDIVDALAGKGIIDAFPIQEQTIPLALSGQDIIGQAKTGTGKTFGFGLPIIQRLGDDPEGGVKALVVVPTRELCVQVTEDLELATSNRPDEDRVDLRRQGLRGPDRAAQGRRADRRRHARPPARPRVAAPALAEERQRAGARRGRQDARPRLPRRHREARRADAGRRGTPCCSRPRCPARSSRSRAAS